MITAITIDDEPHCIDRLNHLLAQHHKSSIQVLSSFQSVEEGVAAIQQLQPDLVFLDVQINDKTGFDVLHHFDAISFAVIFTTAYEKYAIQAIKFSAVDYLLKPIDNDELKAAIDKLKDKLSKDDLAKKFDVLFHNLKHKDAASKRISIPTVNGFEFLPVSDIIRCESHINYTILFLKDEQEITVAKTLKEFEELLTDYNFFRVHNSHLVNLAYIKRYNKGKGGFVCMSDNSEIEVSTRRRDEFLKRLAMM